MRSIAINGRFLSQPTTGVQRYALELLRALDNLLNQNILPKVPVIVYVPRDTQTLPSYSQIQVERVGRFRGQLWEQIDLAKHASGKLLFTPCGGSPILHRPHIITIHDACPFATPDAFTRLYGIYYRNLFRAATLSASHVLTVSEFSRQEIIRYLSVPEDKITVTHLSGEHILRYPNDTSILDKYQLKKGKYILAVSSRNPNKNFSNLIAACRLLPASDIQVAIAGGSNDAIFGKVSLAKGSFVQVGFVNDTELRNLYKFASCFVFPSLYEGFGLPPLEAITLGCPTIVAHTASMPEVLGGAVVYCDPYSPQDIANKIGDVLNGDRPDLDIMTRQSSLFTWDQCAMETWSIITKNL